MHTYYNYIHTLAIISTTLTLSASQVLRKHAKILVKKLCSYSVHLHTYIRVSKKHKLKKPQKNFFRKFYTLFCCIFNGNKFFYKLFILETLNAHGQYFK